MPSVPVAPYTVFGRSRLLLTILSGSLLSFATGCSDGAPTGPPGGSDLRTIQVGRVVTGTLAAGTEETFGFEGRPGEWTLIFFHVDPAAGARMNLEWRAPDGTSLASLTSRGTRRLGDQATVGREISDEGTHTVRITGVSSSDEGDFSLYVSSVVRNALQVGDSVEWQALHSELERQTFWFEATGGQEVRVFIGTPSPFSTDRLDLVVLRAEIADTLGVVFVTGREGDRLDGNSTPTFPIPETDRYRIRVSGTGPNLYGSLPFRLFLYEVHPEPETASATFAVGDTVSGETIEYTGDVDEFTVPLEEGQLLNVFFQAMNGDGATRLQLEIVGPQDEVYGPLVETPLESYGTDATLYDRGSGRVTVPYSGDYSFTVAAHPDAPTSQGPYQFFVFPVDRAPEVLGSALPLETLVEGEAIDLPGDVDEFSFTLDQDSEITLWSSLDVALTPGAQGLITRLLDATTGEPAVFDLGDYEGWTPIPAGDYRLEVTASESLTGPFRLAIFRMDRAPETVSPDVQIGTAVAGETVYPSPDWDTFFFQGTRGQHVDLQLITDTAFMGVWVRDLQQDVGVAAARIDEGGEARTNRFILETDGEYSVRVSRAGNPDDADDYHDEVPYEFLLSELSAGPETAAADVAVGDSVAEAIDEPGDADEFRLTADAGTSPTVLFRYVGGDGLSALVLQVLDPFDGTVLLEHVNGGAETDEGSFPVPASGTVTVRVLEPRGECFPPDPFCGEHEFRSVGDYWFQVLP